MGRIVARPQVCQVHYAIEPLGIFDGRVRQTDVLNMFHAPSTHTHTHLSHGIIHNSSKSIAESPNERRLERPRKARFHRPRLCTFNGIVPGSRRTSRRPQQKLDRTVQVQTHQGSATAGDGPNLISQASPRPVFVCAPASPYQ